MTAAPVVICLGNDLRGDDGAGLEVARLLRPLLPAHVALLESDGDPAEIVDAWAGAPLAVVVDAVVSGAPPGTVHHQAGLDARAGSRPSSHALGLADAATAPPPAALDLDAVADMVTQIVTYWTGPGRERMLARYEISLESVRHPELRERFLATGAALRATIGEAFAQLGAPDPHRAGRDFAAMLDGLVYDQLAGAGGSRTAAELRATIRQMLAGLLTAPPAAGRAGRVRP